MIDLPQPIARYVEAANAQDGQRVAAAFLPNATVHDEGRVHRGRDEIAAWAGAAAKEYGATISPRSVDQGGERCTLHAEVSGNFRGSPAMLAFHFLLQADAIESLEVTA